MYCSGCGQEVAGQARFCPRCGRAMQMPLAGSWDGIVRPRLGRKLAGVCAGLSVRYGWDLTLVRWIAVLAGLFTFPFAVIVYGVLWVALPEEPLYLPAPDTSVHAPGPTAENAG